MMSNKNSTTITQHLVEIKNLISTYEKKYGREKDSVKLLAISKKQSIEKIKEAIYSGQYCFGESYLQEALTKIIALSQQENRSNNIEWHFVGPVQSNKTKKIAEYFDWVHSIDNMHIAERLNNQRPSHLPALNICIQVNVSHELSKSGLNESDVIPFAKHCLTLPHLTLRGLMTLPAPTHQFDEQRKAFRKLFSLKQALHEQGIFLDTLSMGMSDDFEAAIAEGSTLVRIGTAIFGSRTN